MIILYLTKYYKQTNSTINGGRIYFKFIDLFIQINKQQQNVNAKTCLFYFN
jgi:hypothetical protein